MPLLVGVAKGTSRKPGLETLLIDGGGKTIQIDFRYAPALGLFNSTYRDESIVLLLRGTVISAKNNERNHY